MNLIIFIDNKCLESQPHKSLATVRVGGLTLLQRVLRASAKLFEQTTILAPSHFVLPPDTKVAPPTLIHYEEDKDLEAALIPETTGTSDQLCVCWLQGLLSRDLFCNPPANECQITKNGQNTGVYFLNTAQVPPPEHVAQLQTRLEQIHDTHEAQGGLFCPIHQKSDLAKAQSILTRSLRKPLGRESDGLVAYFINRPMSLQISRLLANSPITPNMITAVGLIIGLLAAFLVAQGSYIYMVVGAVLWQTSSMLDGVDGELARMRLAPSHSGEWFDTIADDIINVSFLVGLGHGASVQSSNSLYFTLALIVAVCMQVSLLWFYREFIKMGIASHNHYEWGFEKESKLAKTQAVKPSPLKSIADKIATAFSWIAKRDFYTFLIMLMLIATLTKSAFFLMLAGTAFITVGALIQLSLSALRKNKKKA